MNHSEKREYLIKKLISEKPEYLKIAIPPDEDGQRWLLRALMNVREPAPIDEEFLGIQDEYLAERREEKGTTKLGSLTPVEDGIYLWQGDITTLEVDSIVNAANSGMTGCYVPGHACIDNAIHTFAGIQLRLDCADQMRRQGHSERTGGAKITPAYNLPSKYVLHTVGPIITGPLTQEDERMLASCYNSCLELAEENGLSSVAFCCVSTGEFHFPNRRAAEIAVETVREYRERNKSDMKVVFNVFKDSDFEIYRDILEKS